jgi:HK97 family phage prohead protease
MKKKINHLTKIISIKKFFDSIGIDDACSKGLVASCSKNFKYSSKDRIVTGYATTENIDYVRDRITFDAMKNSKDDLLHPGTNVVLYNHNDDLPIGKVLSTVVDNIGMKVKVLISKSEDVKDIWTKIKERIIKSFSIRFIPLEIKTVKDDNGNVTSYDIVKMRMLEVSLVSIPMNNTANVTDVIGKSLKINLKGSKKMKNVKTNSKETKSEKSLVVGILDELLDDSDSTINKTIAGAIEKSFKEFSEKMNVTEKKTEDKNEKDKTEETLSETVSKLEGKKKSLDGVTEEKKDTNNIPKKVLKSVEDKETSEYVTHIMEKDITGEYDKLSEEEKRLANAVYIYNCANKSK